MKKLPILKTNNLVDFLNLSPTDFERIVYWIVEEGGKFDNVEHIGGTGDEAKDVIGYKDKGDGNHSLTYFNCKRYKDISPGVLKKELDEINKHPLVDGDRLEAIYFCTAESVSPQGKKEIKKHGKSYGFKKIIFWGRTELDNFYKKSESLKKEFLYEDDKTQSNNQLLNGKVDLDILKEIHENVVHLMENSDKHIDFPVANVKSNSFQLSFEGVSENLNKIKENIENGNYSPSIETELNKCIGKLELAEDENKKDLFRAYNLLGIIYLRRAIPENKEGILKAVDFFKKALTYDPGNFKGINNLYLCYINLGEVDLIDDNVLEKFIEEPLIIQIKTYKIQLDKGNDKAIEYLDEEFKKDESKLENQILSGLYADLLLREKSYDKCIEICEKINSKEKKAENYLLLGNAYLEKALEKDKIGEEQFSIIFGNKENVLKAVKAYEEGLNLKSITPIIKNYLEVHLFQAKSILGEDKVNIPKALDEDIREYHSARAVQLFKERKYDDSYAEFTRAIKVEDAHEGDAFQLAIKFLHEGQYEIAEDIFNKANITDKNLLKNKYINLSVIGILKNDKNFSLTNAEKAKELAGDVGDQAHSNFNGVNMRFGEVNRAVENLFHMHKERPDRKILESKGVEEVKKIFEQHRNFIEKLVSIFKEQPFPYYLLTGKMFLNKSYIEFWRGNYGIIPIKYNIGSAERTNYEKEKIKVNKKVIVDYVSLLTLSVFNGLDLLKKYFNEIYISKELFCQIQNDLVQCENINLRNVWEFLRRNKDIIFVRKIDIDNLNQKEIFDFFEDEWVQETASIAKEKGIILLTDDLRFGNFLSVEKIEFINSASLMQLAKKDGFLDKNVYSRALGEIALKGYEFIQFDADDVICLEENSFEEISSEVKKLFNQIAIDNAEFKSFMKVAQIFIEKIKKLAISDNKKIEYLKFFTKAFEKKYAQFYSSDRDNGPKRLAKAIYKLWNDSYNILKINKKMWNENVEDVFSIAYLYEYKNILLK